MKRHIFVKSDISPGRCRYCGGRAGTSAHRHLVEHRAPPNVKVTFIGQMDQLVMGQHLLIDGEEYVVVKQFAA